MYFKLIFIYLSCLIKKGLNLHIPEKKTDNYFVFIAGIYLLILDRSEYQIKNKTAFIYVSETYCSSAIHFVFFFQVMSGDFMFFNFVVCVIPPLLICAVLYFLIYLNLPNFRKSGQMSTIGVSKNCVGVTSNNLAQT